MNIVQLNVPLIVGSGAAGLSVALGLRRCAIFTMAKLANDGSSEHAQGGVAASMSQADSPLSHAEDTLLVSAGLGDEEAIRLLTEDGPAAIDRIIALGAEFDRDPQGALALGREAGHSRRRIVHAQGDATGREVMRVLGKATRERENIRIFEEHRVVELIISGGAICGVVAHHPGGITIYLASVVVLATGGIGRLYSRTTNPEYVRGDGIALATRVGAHLVDLEFVQFHPTALLCGHDPLPLLTEALRGEGAHLLDDQGQRYMLDIHPDAELAPRDIVARAGFLQAQRGGTWLDATCIGPSFPERFPTVFSIAEAAGLDPREEALPISPAAHYFMGGVDVDMMGQTSVHGLFAVGEVSSTGVHGANRLASNSLLEGFVFGSRVAKTIASGDWERATMPTDFSASDQPDDGDRAVIEELREHMWFHAGIVRDNVGLQATLAWIQENDWRLKQTIQGRNASLVCSSITKAALSRKESRGSHFRKDFPGSDPGQASRTRVRDHFAI